MKIIIEVNTIDGKTTYSKPQEVDEFALEESEKTLKNVKNLNNLSVMCLNGTVYFNTNHIVSIKVCEVQE